MGTRPERLTANGAGVETEARRREAERIERRHFWIRVGVAATAVAVLLSMPVAARELATLSAVMLVAFPFTIRWLGRGASLARSRVIARVAVAFYVAQGALWVVLLAPNEEDLALAIAAPALAAAATLGLTWAVAGTAALMAAELLSEALRGSIYAHRVEPIVVALELAAIVGIGAIVGYGNEALRRARRARRRIERAQALLAHLAPQIAGTLDEGVALRRIIGAAIELTRANGGSIAARDATSDRYKITCVDGDDASLTEVEPHSGRGVTGLVLGRGETVQLRGEELSGQVPEHLRGRPIAAEMGTPLRIGERIAAVAVVWTDRREGFDDLDRSALESFATLAATALANAQLYGRAELERRRLRLLHEVDATVSSSLHLDQILERALVQLDAAFGMTPAFVLLVDEDGSTLRVRAHRGTAREDVGRFAIPVTEGLCGAAFRARRPVNVADVRKDARYVLTSSEILSEIALPLLVGDSVVGVLLVSSSRLAACGPDEEALLELFAGQLAVAVANARAYEAQREAAVRDDRTGLFNHRYFQEALEQEVAAAERRGSPLSLLFMDLDHLKRINDRYGHDAGDAVIRRVSQLLIKARRRSDVAARIGGEEFALLLPDTPGEDALTLAERLRAAAARDAAATGGAPIRFTLSIGVAAFPTSARGALEIRRAADMAMYAAKHAGRDRVVAAGPIPQVAPA